ncbi:inorganic diphosphatase [Buchnera aphidicola]|uniref:Inorganic pyrophosphatase n=1 Tax=Buchnera aphidicola subsp. Melaphis rhois TaxID=118103 RepID=A0A4D6Y0D1_BUCMH|nr:inorganic diphosphatase [Buchnera aphidicola]QCI23122.1 inorganic diphosphatase [Buchnera aphidicola (Melaphis rhois)]
MSLKNISPGENVPYNINVIIEIPSHSNPVKYEINKNSGILFVDRFIPTSMFYPCNYGFINKTLSCDGDPIDVLVHSPYPLISNSVIQCRPIGILRMIDESGIDNKVIALPNKHICHEYSNIENINDLSNSLKTQIVHFFKHYKDLEKNKWVKIIGWEDKEIACQEILSSLK